MSSSFGLSPLLLQRLQRLGMQNPAAPDDEKSQALMAQRMQPPQGGQSAEIPLDMGRFSAPPQNRLGQIPAGRDAGFRFGRDEAPATPLGDEIPLAGMSVLPQRQPQEIPLGLAAQRLPAQGNAPVDMSGRENFSRITAPPEGGFLTQMRDRQPAQDDDVDPGAIRQAIMSQRAGYAQAVEPGEAQERARRMLAEGPTQHHGSGGFKGFVEHVVDGLKGLGKGYLATGNPIAALGMGVASGIHPQYAHNIDFNMNLPAVLHAADAEADIQGRQLQRARLGQQLDYEPLKLANTLSQINRRGQQGDQGDQRNDINGFRAWAANAPPGTSIPDEYADALHYPRGSKIWHKGSSRYVKDQSGNTYSMEGNTASPVTTADGSTLRSYVPQRAPRVLSTRDGYMQFTPGQGDAPPVVQPVPRPGGGTLQPPAPRAGQAPHFVYSGRARAELRKESNITNDNALVDNPAFADAFEQKKAAEIESSKSGHYVMPSDAEIAQSVSKKVPRKVKAGSLVTPDMVNERAAQIYEREHGGKGRAPASGSRVNQQQMAAHEKEYQSLYPKLSPEDRQYLENEFKKHYGRAPRRPQ